MTAAARQAAFAQAAQCAPCVAALEHLTPRQTGSVVFQGYGRASVRAVAAHWASLSDADHGGARAIAVPGAVALSLSVSASKVEVDLDAASGADIRAFFAWTAVTLRSRHCLYGVHVVVIHGAENADAACLARISQSHVVVASTTQPDSRAIRALVGAWRLRVPDPTFAVPPPAAAACLSTERVEKESSVLVARHVVRDLRVAGFTHVETVRFARAAFCPAEPVSAMVAELAHAVAAPLVNGPAIRDRATEAVVLDAILRFTTPPSSCERETPTGSPSRQPQQEA